MKQDIARYVEECDVAVASRQNIKGLLELFSHLLSLNGNGTKLR